MRGLCSANKETGAQRHSLARSTSRHIVFPFCRMTKKNRIKKHHLARNANFSSCLKLPRCFTYTPTPLSHFSSSNYQTSPLLAVTCLTLRNSWCWEVEQHLHIPVSCVQLSFNFYSSEYRRQSDKSSSGIPLCRSYLHIAESVRRHSNAAKKVLHSTVYSSHAAFPIPPSPCSASQQWAVPL